MHLKCYLLVTALAVCFSLQGNSAKKPKGYPVGISLLGNDIQDGYQYEDEPSDYIQSSEEVSQEQKGVGHLLRKMYQHIYRVDERLANVEDKLVSFSNHQLANFKTVDARLAMVEKKLTSPNHKVAQHSEMAQTSGDCYTQYEYYRTTPF